MANQLPAYTTMASVYDKWMELDQAPYSQWCQFIHKAFQASDAGISTVLDIGCGTGSMTATLESLGYVMTGVDPSAEMLQIAKAKLSPKATLLHTQVPSTSLNQLGGFDAAISCFDTVNYLTADEQLESAFSQVGTLIKPGGVFVFDVNTRYKLESIFGRYHSGDDFGDFAYVWRNRYDPETSTCPFDLTFFIKQGDTYLRTEERHVQRWFSADRIAAALTAAGFGRFIVTDAYTDKPAGKETRRETWVATHD